MRALSSRLRQTVFRVTVDEVLDDSVARLLVAELAEGAADLTEDRRENWQDEKAYWVHESDALRFLTGNRRPVMPRALEAVTGGRPARGARFRFWRGLREGQVFLVGRFEIAGPRHAPESVRVSRRRKSEFLRVDQLPRVRGDLAALYARALTGRSGDAPAGHQ